MLCYPYRVVALVVLNMFCVHLFHLTNEILQSLLNVCVISQLSQRR